jgi:hypothetical protein
MIFFGALASILMIALAVCAEVTHDVIEDNLSARMFPLGL